MQKPFMRLVERSCYDRVMTVACKQSFFGGLSQTALSSQSLLKRRIRSRSSVSPVGSLVRDVGSASIIGTSRKVNEDRFDYQYVEEEVNSGEINTYASVFDGHGGVAVSEMLENTFREQIDSYWISNSPQSAIAKAFVDMDRKLLQRPPGFIGAFGERGVGGSKCGATAATAVIFKGESGGYKLLAANIGDSRVILIRNGTAVQLTQDHVPDREEERIRIEKENPNPRMPLVRFVGGTWRVGGILALSRAFGDAYMKGNLQFEGIDSGSDYSTGFGVIADPYISVTDLKKDDSWLLIHSDGLNNTEIRGGGGGLTNEQVATFCSKSGSQSAQSLAEKLVIEAQKAGSTDDVTVVCLKLVI